MTTPQTTLFTLRTDFTAKLDEITERASNEIQGNFLSILGMIDQFIPFPTTPFSKFQRVIDSARAYAQYPNYMNYMQKYRMTIPEALSKFLDTAKFVIAGEYHSAWPPNFYQARIADALPTLKSRGLTVVALEMDRRYQTKVDALDYFSPNIDDEVKKIAPDQWSKESRRILIEAKKLGLRVLCLDYHPQRSKPKSSLEEKIEENQRDQKMFQSLKSQVSSADKVLIVIGGQHAVKKPSVGESEKGITRLGARLTSYYGGNQVVSIRYIRKGYYLDGKNYEFTEANKKPPQVCKLLPHDIQPLIVPDQGPFKGDPKETAHDFVAIDPQGMRPPLDPICEE